MYKKTHTQEKGSLAEPYCRKSSFACLVPWRVIMLTKDVYHIQLKNRKNYWTRISSFLIKHVVNLGNNEGFQIEASQLLG